MSKTIKPNKAAFEHYLYLKAVGFSPDLAKMIIAQSAHETGNFTSRIYRENFNLFGMKLPAVRSTTATGQKYGHAVYDSFEDSIKDYMLYWKARDLPVGFNSVSEFVSKLKEKNYFEQSLPKYTKAVQCWYKIYWDEYNN